MSSRKNRDLQEVTGLSKDLDYENEDLASRKEIGTSNYAAEFSPQIINSERDRQKDTLIHTITE
jgi:hypothetical protein